MRAAWDAHSIPPGELRSAIDGVLERHRVSVRDVVVWRTGGTIANAAVVGVFPSLRYLAFTDAMLDALGDDELEAVTAHEAAHLRKRHVPWLAGAVLATVAATGGLLGTGAILIGFGGEVSLVVVSAMTIGVTLLTLGAVSRRFEWQADAFAAAHLSGESPTLTQQASDAMSFALRRVAALNKADPNRFDWRHGSITERRRRLAAVVGQPLDRLPQDRAVRVLIIAVLVMLPIGIALTALEALLIPTSS